MKDYHLERFVSAQNSGYADYERALSEMRAGRKKSHWIWYIFPQLRALGKSDQALFYGIEDAEEARQYFAHPVLGARLIEISEAILGLKDNDPLYLMAGNTDKLKLCSCMTLFAQIEGKEDSVFRKVLDKFFGGEMDANTLSLLQK